MPLHEMKMKRLRFESQYFVWFVLISLGEYIAVGRSKNDSSNAGEQKKPSENNSRITQLKTYTQSNAYFMEHRY